ncbi:MAG: lytic murein transglycosylase [Rhodobacteraceae bacterium]|nr:lytic murein transglycosylase [Paracoccaceae bacterium]
MRIFTRIVATSFLTLGLAAPVLAQSIQCGGSFSTFMRNVAAEAASRGLPDNAIRAVVNAAQQNDRVLRFDRSQGVFRQTFLEFSQRSISSSRLRIGAEKTQQYRSVFDRAQRDYGVPPEVILAFWALETDYGVVQGDFNTVSALATLAHDCRRPDLFQPELFAAIALTAQGDLNPASMTGAWAGEIGMVQMLPLDILERGMDGDGDGRVTLKTSAPDAILTAARLVADLGWYANEPWLQEVTVPSDFPWEQAGLDRPMTVRQLRQLGVRAREGSLQSGNAQATLLLPQGRNGPKFITYRNYDVYREWNHSFVYQATVSYMATRIGGAARYDAGNPDEGLSGDQMERLQRILQNRGYDVGGIDGVLGARTRAAVRNEQLRLGMPADAWPTPGLLARY